MDNNRGLVSGLDKVSASGSVWWPHHPGTHTLVTTATDGCCWSVLSYFLHLKTGSLKDLVTFNFETCLCQFVFDLGSIILYRFNRTLVIIMQCVICLKFA